MDGEMELLADQPLGQKLIKKGFWLYFFMIFLAPTGYFIRVIISNTLSIEDVGLFYSIFGLVTLISMYNDLGLTEALQYFLPKYRIEKKYNNFKTIIYLTLFVQVISGIIIAGAMWIGANWLAIHHFHSIFAKDILRLFCWYFIGINFIQVLNSIYISFQDVVASNLTEGAKMRSTLGFTLIFRLTGTLTINNFALGWICGLGIGLLASTIIFIAKYKKTLKKGIVILDRSLLKTHFHYAFWIFLGANILTLFSQVDQQMVINFLGVKQAGYYANFWGMIAIFNFLAGPLLSILFPIVNELITKKEINKLKFFQNILYKYFSVFALTVGGIFIALGPQISSIMFGVKFAYSGALATYIGPFLIFNILFIINYFILAGIGKIRKRVEILGIALSINVVSNIILIYMLGWGLIGAVISLILGRISLWWLSYKLVNNHLKIDFDWGFFIKNALIVTILTIFSKEIANHTMTLENTMRYKNIGYLLLIILCYYIVIGILNRENARILINEIKKMKKN
ncbi:MAG: oligosaccharide flippase family protein [candidate division SR1 bacterium]|nr:oligosaccharide flippase family protein [candidate division SR1 bacterium]